MSKTLIIGDGEIGKVMGAALHSRNHDFAFLGRTTYCEKPCCNFKIHSDSGLYEYSAPRSVHPHGFTHKFDNVMFAVRNDHLETAIAQTRDIWARADNLLFLQGGMQWWLGEADSIKEQHIRSMVDIDNISRFKPLFAGKTLWAGMIGFACASNGGRNETSLTHKGSLMLGALDKQSAARNVFGALLGDNEFFALETIDDIYKYSFRKLCNSAALNAASLKWNKPIGWLVENRQAYNYMLEASSYMGQGLAAFGLQCQPDCPLYLHILAEKYPFHYMSLLRNEKERRYLHDMPFALARAGHDRLGGQHAQQGIYAGV